MIKVIGAEIALSTANTVARASAVRVVNDTAGSVLITRANTGGTIGSCTLHTLSAEVFEKDPDDTLAASAAVKAAPVAYN